MSLRSAESHLRASKTELSSIKRQELSLRKVMVPTVTWEGTMAVTRFTTRRQQRAGASKALFIRRRNKMFKRNKKDRHKPYRDDLTYLDEELHWIETHCRCLVTRKKLAAASNKVDDFDFASDRYNEDDPRQLKKRLKVLQADADDLREHIDGRLVAHREAGKSLALDAICEEYELDGFERTVVLLAAAPAFSRRFDEIYGETDSKGYSSGLTVEVVFEFMELPFAERIDRRAAFAPGAKLVGCDLIKVEWGHRYTSPKDLLGTDIDITPRTFAAILGDNRLPHEFMEFSSVEPPRSSLVNVVLDEADKRRILSVVDRHAEWLQKREEWGFDDVIGYGRGALMLFYGPPGTGKTMTAHGVAGHLGKRVLNVDIPTFLGNSEAERFLPALFREARLQDAVLFFDECEALFGSRRNGNLLMTLLLTEIERFEGVAILATNLPDALDEALDRRILVKVRFPEPDRAARRAIWAGHLPDSAPLAPDVDLDMLADRYELSGGYIKNAVLMAVAAAVHGGGDDPHITTEHLSAAARDQLVRPTNEEEDLIYPKVQLADVVLHDDLQQTVTELVAAARNYRTVLHRWGIGRHLQRTGCLAALLHGPPGTGKTLTAEAIANELGRPLRVTGAAGVVSKWVGQTERNLEKLFARCKADSAVLLIDECDSLLMARGEGRASRHDDAAVNTLLRLLERHDGVVLLATNRPDHLDPALKRRLLYDLPFRAPGMQQRVAIWRGLLPESVPTEGRLSLRELGRKYPITGASIHNAVTRAAFRAAHEDRSLSQADLELFAASEQFVSDRAEIAVLEGVEA